MIFDLHVHTNCSDGLLSYKEVIDLGIKKGLNGISITDHDTISAIGPAIVYSKSIHDFHVIPGIEFGCTYGIEEVHILGYFIDYNSYDIMNITGKLKESRITRSYKMVEILNDLGMKLSIDEVRTLTTEDYIGRPHIARVLVKKGYVNDSNEAFDKYIGFGKPAYVERFKLSINETIALIHKAGGIAILAHPGLLKNQNIIRYCIDLGIDGLEVIHSKHNKNQIKYFLDVGKKHDLILTGGSDCHGKIINNGYLLGKYYINLNHIPNMKGRI